MPIYAYKCASCGLEKEALQKISEDPLTECPACGKATLVKQVTAAGFQLKGSGWYVTDFRDSGKKPADGATSVPSPKTGSESANPAAAGGGDAAPASSGDGATTAPATPAPALAPAAAAPAVAAGSKPAGQ